MFTLDAPGFHYCRLTWSHASLKDILLYLVISCESTKIYGVPGLTYLLLRRLNVLVQFFPLVRLIDLVLPCEIVGWDLLLGQRVISFSCRSRFRTLQAIRTFRADNHPFHIVRWIKRSREVELRREDTFGLGMAFGRNIVIIHTLGSLVHLGSSLSCYLMWLQDGRRCTLFKTGFNRRFSRLYSHIFPWLFVRTWRCRRLLVFTIYRQPVLLLRVVVDIYSLPASAVFPKLTPQRTGISFWYTGSHYFILAFVEYTLHDRLVHVVWLIRFREVVIVILNRLKRVQVRSFLGDKIDRRRLERARGFLSTIWWGIEHIALAGGLICIRRQDVRIEIWISGSLTG